MKDNRLLEFHKKIIYSNRLLLFAELVSTFFFWVIQIVLWRTESQLTEVAKYVFTELALLFGGLLQYHCVAVISRGMGKSKNVTSALKYYPIQKRNIFRFHAGAVFCQQLTWVILIILTYRLRARIWTFYDIFWFVCLVVNPLWITCLRERRFLSGRF